MVTAFGILTSIMCIRFLPQEFQPLRKKIIFSIMSVSAWITVVYNIRLMRTAKSSARHYEEHTNDPE